MKTRWAMILLLLASGQLVRAGIGDVDPAYGQNGRVQSAQVPLDGGRVLRAVGDGYGWIDASGQLDLSFGNQGKHAWPGGFTPNWKAWLRLPDGSMLLGGYWQASGAVLRLDAAGEIDAAFAGSGMLLLSPRLNRCRVEDMKLQPDGGLLVLTGEYYEAYYLDTPVQVFVRRFSRSLDVDTAFGQNGETLVADYRTTSADYPYVEIYMASITALADGNIAYTDDYSGSLNAPLLDQVRTRLRYVSVLGLPATGIDRSLDPLIPDWKLLGRLSDGKVLLDGFVPTAGGIHYRIARRNADGGLDTTFGQAGFFTLDDQEGNAVPLSTVSEDEQYAYLVHESSDATVVARIELQGVAAGQLDTAFGQQGVARLKAPLHISALSAAADGSLVLVGQNSTFRLLPSPLPSPGFVSFVTDYVPATQPGQLTIRVTRSGGSAGALSVDFATESAQSAGTDAAVAGRDYQPVTGTLTWADGESGDKTFSVTILPEYMNSSRDYRPIGVMLGNLSGGLWIEVAQLRIFSQPAAVAAPAPSGGVGASASGTGSGGGALDLVSLVALCLASSARLLLRRRCRHCGWTAERWESPRQGAG